jgi:hypothetical protein
MRTLKQQLENATAIFLMDISSSNSSGSRARYSAYVMKNGELEVLWPDAPEIESKEYKKLNMSHCSMKQYPAFHFIRNGYGYSKSCDVLNDICEYAGRRIPGFMLNGYSPSPISTQWSAMFDKKEEQVSR